MKKRGKASRFSAEQRRAVAVEYLTSDKSCREIGAEIGVSGQTVYSWAMAEKERIAKEKKTENNEEV